MTNDGEIRAVITGATGMVGEGVLHECLLHPQVKSVLLINRKPSGIIHPKIREIIHQDFFDFSAIENQLFGYNACFLLPGCYLCRNFGRSVLQNDLQTYHARCRNVEQT